MSARSARVAVVTGAGRGLGREHALALAASGYAVVVNDLDVAVDGSVAPTATGGAADAVVEEIRRAGGTAVVSTDDVATWSGAENVVQAAVEAFGRLDALVCNAGTLLDRSLVDMSQADWDSVVSTHLTGHAAPLHHAARHWRESGAREGRVVLTGSAAGVWGDVGRTNYSSAKAGIVLLGRTAARELADDGVCVNVIAPFARTRMTVGLYPGLAAVPPPGTFDAVDPGNVSPLVVWLCSADASGVTGQVFEVHAGHLGLIEEPRHGPSIDLDRRFDLAEIGPAVARLLATKERLP